MAHRSPLVTLLGLVGAFVIMLGANVTGTERLSAATPSPNPSASTPAPSSAAPPPSSSSSPTPTVSASPRRTPRPSPRATGEAFPDRAVYAGRTRDGSTAVAVAVLGRKAAAYLCDGRRVEAWLRGTVDGDTVSLRSKNGRTTLEAKLVDGRLRGAVDLDGEALWFRIGAAEPPAGLYRARGERTTIGWIVLPDGSQVGLATTGGESAPAPRIDPAAPQVNVDGESLTGAPVTGELESEGGRP